MQDARPGAQFIEHKRPFSTGEPLVLFPQVGARVVRPDAVMARPTKRDAIFWRIREVIPCIGHC
jgi:hypothetical protein